MDNNYTTKQILDRADDIIKETCNTLNHPMKAARNIIGQALVEYTRLDQKLIRAIQDTRKFLDRIEQMNCDNGFVSEHNGVSRGDDIEAVIIEQRQALYQLVTAIQMYEVGMGAINGLTNA